VIQQFAQNVRANFGVLCQISRANGLSVFVFL
jgi:hypothetical protein